MKIKQSISNNRAALIGCVANGWQRGQPEINVSTESNCEAAS